MATINPDDDFDWGALEAELNEDVSGVVDVSSLTVPQLLDKYHGLTEELKQDRTEALRPTEQSSRDKHSLRNACYVELKKRGLL